MLTQTELKTLFRKYDFSPLKRFGENYLVDGNVKDKIIREAALSRQDMVLEIGPGFGALTFDLVSAGASVFAVEKDKKAFAILEEMAGEDHPKLKIFNEDILEFDLDAVLKGVRIKVVGNLPYYITTPVIEYMIGHRDIIGSALVLMQKEVADRLLAKEGDKERGSISCFVQYYTKPEYLFTIKRNSFYPVPDVDSALLRLTMLDKPDFDVKDEDTLFRIVRGAFNQRRKSIINSLSREAVLNMAKNELISLLERLNIDPASRPEDLPLSSFALIANSVS